MKTPVLTVAVLLTASPAFAHVDATAQGSFMAGLAHPVLGADHLLSMLAVGILAASTSGKARWALPAAFVAAMATGFALALGGVQIPMVEPAILASVIVLCGLVALAAKLPAGGLVMLGSAFGLFHGAAHGAEIGTAGVAGFAAGMLIATAGLCGAGSVATRSVLARLNAARASIVLRSFGLGMALVGTGTALA